MKWQNKNILQKNNDEKTHNYNTLFEHGVILAPRSICL